MYKYYFSKDVTKFLVSQDNKFLRKFYGKLEILAKDPYNINLDVKQLKWISWNYRLRIWKYRFLYEIKDNSLIIYFYKAWSRWNIYKGIK